MSAHTPGPWKFGELSRDIIDSRGRLIAEVGEWNGPDGGARFEANARLISAAPDLLEACKAILTEAEERGCVTSRLRAAIAKAGGES